jgi:starch synthase (maltosyl-transferring)
MLNQKRVVVDYVSPAINNGEFPIKRVVHEIVNIDAHVLVDGHDVISASVLFKHEKANKWEEVRMHPTHNDEWKASFHVTKQGYYSYKIAGWVDYALNWQHGIKRKVEDNQVVKSELLEGAELIESIYENVDVKTKTYFDHLKYIFKHSKCYDEAIQEATSDKLHQIFVSYPDKQFVGYSREYKIYVDRKKARFSTWYEFFPRSSSEIPYRHGTFKDCERLLSRVAEMGFDTLYFPPIHPIGEVNRKGKNNTAEAFEGDVGSPWGIGSKHGGHKDIHPQLGSIEDFKQLIKKAKTQGLEIAMDFALQAAPDHPWVKTHSSWFKWRPDGTVQYAENPPKKYQDILPIYWESTDYENLWKECLDILLYWIECGVEIFRVDNPHTKPYYFWHWIIEQVKAKHPDVIFLAEAFTKPKVMAQLAKQGFTQSYTYFTWRNSKHEFIEYINELTKTELREFMQPNFWPNTPDINPYHLQGANESVYLHRYALAATLSSSIGIYGPVFEQMISDALPGREEYLNSEKFQICHYNWEAKNKLTTVISKINLIRKENEALQQTNNIEFCNIENNNLIAFYKWNENKTNQLLIIISLEPYYAQQGMLQVPLHHIAGIAVNHYAVHDLVTGSSYNWSGEWNFVELHPTLPFHIFKLKT